MFKRIPVITKPVDPYACGCSWCDRLITDPDVKAAVISFKQDSWMCLDCVGTAHQSLTRLLRRERMHMELSLATNNPLAPKKQRKK